MNVIITQLKINLAILLFQKCLSNWYHFALSGAEGVTPSFKKIGDPWLARLIYARTHRKSLFE